MAVNTKIKSFEYLVFQLRNWFLEVNPGADPKSNFNKLKILKLHFFASAVNADNENDGLLNVFNNFYAMPYGHVESDIYSHIDNLQSLTVSSYSVEFKEYNEEYFSDISQNKRSIDLAIESLKKENSELVNYSAMDLVEISHQWHSWKSTFFIARQLNKFSLQIPNDIIKKESKFFKLEKDYAY